MAIRGSVSGMRADEAAAASPSSLLGIGWRWAGIAALRTVAWLLLVAGVWAVPLSLAFWLVPRGPEGGPAPWWAWMVLEATVATLGLSQVTWWVADWLDECPPRHDPHDA